MVKSSATQPSGCWSGALAFSAFTNDATKVPKSTGAPLALVTPTETTELFVFVTATEIMAPALATPPNRNSR